MNHIKFIKILIMLTLFVLLVVFYVYNDDTKSSPFEGKMLFCDVNASRDIFESLSHHNFKPLITR